MPKPDDPGNKPDKPPKPEEPTEPPTEPPTGGYQLVTPESFEYLGFFCIPANLYGPKTTVMSKGLAHRYVNGKLRIFLASPWHDQPVCGEFDVPTGQLDNYGSQWAVATGIWQNLGGDKRICTDNNGVPYPSAGNIYGLYWDEVDGRLYWHYANEYEASHWHTACFGYSVINEANTITDVAAYRPAVDHTWGAKMMQSGIVPIPPEFVKDGKRLALGMGGYFSVVTMGPASMGPALTAFNPSNLGAHLSHVDVTPLLGYPFTQGDPSELPRMERDTGYVDVVPGEDYFALAHRDGKGFWTWSDTIHSGGVWIDTPTHKGILFFATMGYGKTFYQTSTLQTEQWRQMWIGYDPAKLKEGNRQVQPNYVTEVPPPTAPYDGGGHVRQYPFGYGPGTTMGGSPDSLVNSGATFDPTTGRLYLLQNRMWMPGEGPERYPGVFVYQLKTTS